MRLTPLRGTAFTFCCIRCGARTASTAPGAGIPFRAYYCAPCAAVRRAERMRADIVHGPIVGAP